MNCNINTDDPKLQELINEFGAKEGVKKYLNKDNDILNANLSLNNNLSKPYQTIVTNLQLRIRNLQNSINKTKDKVKKQRFSNQITDLEKQITNIKEAQDYVNLKDIFNTHKNWINQILDQDTTTNNELYIAGQFIQGWQGIQDLFVDPEDIDNKSLAIVKITDEIEEDVRKLDTKYKAIRNKGVFNEYLSETKRPDKEDVSQNSIVKYIKDVALESYTYDLSGIESPLAQIVDKKTKSTAREVTDKYNNIVKELKVLTNSLKTAGINDFDWMYQKVLNKESGLYEDTGGWVNRYSQEYWNKISEFKDTINTIRGLPNIDKRTAKLKKEITKRNQWYQDNTISVDLRYLNILDYKGISDEEKLDYRDRLNKHFGVDRANEIIEQVLSKYQTYLEKKQDYEAFITSEVDSNTITLESGKEALKVWDLENNPIYFLQQLSGQDITEATKNNIYNKGYNYVITKPRVWGKDGKSTGWYDKQFIDIQNNSEKKAFYDYFTSNIREQMDYLPNYQTNDLKANFIPAIKQDIQQSFLNKDVKGFLTGLRDDFIESITSKDIDNKFELKDPRTGLVIKNIPTRFINDRIDIKERSKDLPTVLEMFSLMALNYKHKTEIEDFINLSVEVIKDARVSPGINKSPDTLLKAVEFVREYSLYGETKLKNEFATEVKVYKNKAQEIRAKEIEIRRDELNKQLENPDITLEEEIVINKELNNLAKEYNSLTGGNLILSKLVDSGIAFQTLKAFAFNPFSAMSNLLFGLFSNSIYISGLENTKSVSYFKALGISLGSLRPIKALTNNPTLNKVLPLMDKFQIESKVGDLDKNPNTSKNGFWKKFKDSPFYLMKSTDYIFRSQLLVAQLMDKQVIDINGNNRSLWEAFDSNGEWDITNFGEEPSLTNIRDNIIQTQKAVHGNFDPNSPILLKKYVLGRMVSQFRASWVFEGFRQRFQGEQFDEQLGTNSKGRYRSLWDQGGLKGILKTIAIDQFKYLVNKSIYNELTPLDKANMRRNLQELYILQSLTLIMIILKAGAGDDDKKTSAYKIAKNLINRSQEDVLFYLSPASFNNIVKNPIPVLSVVSDAQRILNTSYNLVTNDKYKVEDYIKSLTKPIPYLNLYNKWDSWSKREF